MDSLIFSAKTPSNECDKTYNNKKAGISIRFFSANAMKQQFPAGGFSVVGQIGKKTNESIGDFEYNGKKETVYKLKKQRLTKISGYIECETGYIAVVKSTAPVLFLIIIAVLALALLLGFLIKNRPTSDTSAPAETTTLNSVDENAVLGDGEISVPDKIDTASRQIKINGIPEMKLVAGQTSQKYVFSNPEENPCYFQISIIINDTGETIYKSKLLPPGYSISSFELLRALDAGTYAVTVHYDTFSFDKEQRPLNNADNKTDIVAE